MNEILRVLIAVIIVPLCIGLLIYLGTLPVEEHDNDGYPPDEGYGNGI